MTEFYSDLFLYVRLMLVWGMHLYNIKMDKDKMVHKSTLNV